VQLVQERIYWKVGPRLVARYMVMHREGLLVGVLADHIAELWSWLLEHTDLRPRMVVVGMVEGGNLPLGKSHGEELALSAAEEVG
jgi:hypothetical protein